MKKLSLWKKGAIAWQTLFDPRTPFAAKAVVAGALLYGVSPIDFIPDLLPLLGIADDSAIGVIAITAFLMWTKSQRKARETAERAA